MIVNDSIELASDQSNGRLGRRIVHLSLYNCDYSSERIAIGEMMMLNMLVSWNEWKLT